MLDRLNVCLPPDAQSIAALSAGYFMAVSRSFGTTDEEAERMGRGDVSAARAAELNAAVTEAFKKLLDAAVADPRWWLPVSKRVN
jgi:hypothetical protein